MNCDKCGKPTRTIWPYVDRAARSATEAMREDRPIPRSAIYMLNPELERSIPFGEHPDDNMFGNACEACAEAMRHDPAA